MFKVMMSVKGASRLTVAEYATEAEAQKRAERWRRSNAVGSYVATVERVERCGLPVRCGDGVIPV